MKYLAYPLYDVNPLLLHPCNHVFLTPLHIDLHFLLEAEQASSIRYIQGDQRHQRGDGLREGKMSCLIKLPDKH